ncbi:MAG TPA: IPT/TIG domain-containing protein [Bryobacteraceae bacterium]|nr:IPT/TIG domain-containing protein [Bryobacteraceae bacterium]
MIAVGITVRLPSLCGWALLISTGLVPAAQAQTQPAGGGNPQNPTGVYTAAYTLNGGSASQSGQTYAATSDYEFGVFVAGGGILTLSNPAITTSGQIGNGVEASLNTATTGGTVMITGGAISTTGVGGNGIFAAAGGATVSATGTTISCTAQFGHGVLVTYGGSVTLNNVTISTKGGNGAALANDAGGGTVTGTGVTATTAGSGSPGIYAIGSTTVIAVTNSTLTSSGEVGAVTTGGATVVANNSSTTGTTAGVRTFNQGSGTSTATINGGSLTATAGDAFYAQGASGTFTAKGGAVLKASSGNIVNAVTSGAAQFTAVGETLTGNIVADSTSTASASLQSGTTLTGAIRNAGLTLDSTSSWNVTANSTLTSLGDVSGISGSTVTNITGNGYTVTYDATLAANSALGGKTFTLVNGGLLLPAGSVSVSAPAISANGVVNAASYGAGIAPGSWVSIFGSNLASTIQQAGTANLVNGSLPPALAGVSVQIDGQAAFVDYVSPTQINVQAPADTNSGSVQVTVTNGNGTSSAVTATLQQLAPAFFTSSGYVAAVRVDGTVITGSVPANPGDVLELYGTGFGPTSPSVAPGLVFQGADATTNTVSVTIGGTAATVSFAGLASVGLYQVNVVVPSVVSGDQTVVATVNGMSTQSGVLLKVQ